MIGTSIRFEFEIDITAHELSYASAKSPEPLQLVVSHQLFAMPAATNKVFRLERDDNVLIVIPQGDAIGFRYNDVHQESNSTLQILDDATLKHVVVDLGCEQVLGSIIISVLIKICRKAGLKGGKAAFCNATPDMQDVLQTMNLVKLWKYHPTRAEAVVAVRAES